MKLITSHLLLIRFNKNRKVDLAFEIDFCIDDVFVIIRTGTATAFSHFTLVSAN